MCLAQISQKKEVDRLSIAVVDLLPRSQIIVVFLGCAISLCLALLDQTIVSTAIPTIGKDLGDAQDGSWIASAFLCMSMSSPSAVRS